jgi:MoxR-like ATPase
MTNSSAPSVSVKELRNIVKLVIKAKKEGLRIPLAIHGQHGIGKTENVKQIAKEFGYNFVALYLSTQDTSDLLGIPYKARTEVTRPDGTVEVHETTEFATPGWLKRGITSDRPTIFFLDEMNRAEPYVLQTMLPFSLEGTIHDHSIREQDIVVSAMNPESADYNVESNPDLLTVP